MEGESESPKKSRLSLVLAVALGLAGVLINSFTVGPCLFPGGKLADPSGHVLILALQFILIGLAVFLFVSRPHIRPGQLLALVVTCLVSLGLVEIVARLYLGYMADDETFRVYASYRQLRARNPQANSKYSLHRYLGYYLTPDYQNGKNKHNSVGYRGDEIELPKPAGRFRIVCLGGSTTYTSKLADYRLSYPYLLEQELKDREYANVDVVNAGVGNWTSWETLINFELRVLDLEPDMIIIYHALNDIHPRLVWPPEAYRGDNSGRRSPNQRGIFMPSLLEYSTFLRYLTIRFHLTRSHNDIESIIDSAPDTFYGDEFARQKITGTHPSGIFERVSAEQMLAENGPRYFKRNIRSIVTLADEWGVQSIIATFAYSTLFSKYPRVASEEYRKALDEMNVVLRSFAGTPGVSVFDFARVFPIARRFYTDGRHVTVAGAKLKAKLFADFIVERHLIPHSPGRAAGDIEGGRIDGPPSAVNGRSDMNVLYSLPDVQVGTRSSEDR